MGKTNQIKLLLGGLSRCLIVDPFGQYADRAVCLGSYEEIVDYLSQVRPGTGWRISYSAPQPQLVRDFPALCRAMYLAGHCTLVVEEMDWFCSPWEIPDDFQLLIKSGRNRWAGLIGVSQSPSGIHKDIARQSWEIFCYQLQEPNDLKYVRDYCGDAFGRYVAHLAPEWCLWRNLFDKSEPWQEFHPPKA